MLDSIRSIFRAWFGEFEKGELRKFILLGGIFAFVIGVYWTLRPMKDSIFMSLVGAEWQPIAKIVSMVILFPIVIFYNKLVDKYKRHHVFYVLGSIYLVLTILFGLLFMSPVGLGATHTSIITQIIGWAWYVYVESFGSLMVALFWAFAADTSSPESAKKGFSLVVMIGQLGSMMGPKYLTPLGKTVFGNSGPVVLICAALILPIIFGIYYFMHTMPKAQISAFHGKDEAKVEASHEPGFFEGLKLMFTQPYLLGIFGIIAIYEIIITIIDFHFKMLVQKEHASEAFRTAYLGDYAFYVNLISFLCLLFGISNIQRRLGLTTSLTMMPFIVAGMVALFWLYPNIDVLFWLMVGAKAINYALNSPSQKQLYVPTTNDVKYKAQSWIETFGSRGSKAASSLYNNMAKSFQTWFGKEAGIMMHVTIGSFMSLGLAAVWVLIALYLGRTYSKAVQEKRVVC